jgi:hypothetical protein
LFLQSYNTDVIELAVNYFVLDKGEN